jgi:hypothetical protein
MFRSRALPDPPLTQVPLLLVYPIAILGRLAWTLHRNGLVAIKLPYLV